MNESTLNLRFLLQQAYDRLSLAVDAAGIGFWDWNLQTGEVFYDEQWLKMIGYKPGEIEITRTFWEDRIHPDDKEFVMKALNEHYQGKIPDYKTEHRLHTKSGAYIWILDSGRVIERDAFKNPVRIGGISIDITERVVSQHKVQISEEKYKSIFDHLNDAFCRFDFSGRILEVNKNLCDMLSLKPKELCDSNVKLFFNNQTIKYLHRRLTNIIENKSINFETEIITSRHKLLSINISAMLITASGNGEIQAIIRDIAQRKEYEKALFDEKQKFKALIEHSPNVICRFGRNLKCQYASPNMLTIMNIVPENCIGKRLAEMTFPESLAVHLEEKMRWVLRKNREILVNYSFDGPSGLKHFESIFVPEINSSNSVESILLTNADITDKVNRERELNSSKMQLEEAEKNVHFGIYEFNLLNGSSQWSNETYLIFGRDPKLEPLSLEELKFYIHPDDIPLVFDHFKESSEPATNLNVNFRIITSGGNTKYVNCTGRIERNPDNNSAVKIFGTFMDITEKKQIENRLFSERDMLQLIIDNVPDLIYIKDDQKRFIRVNNSLAKYLGLSNPEDVIGKTVYDIFPVEIADELNELDNCILNSEMRLINNELEIPVKGGNFWYSTTIIGVKDVAGKVAQLVGISRDITQYKLSEDQLRKSKEKAEQADQLKSAFLANMSHEIRTPINGILGFANLLELREFPRDKEIQYLRIINNSGKLLLSLINDIIDIAKIEAGQINIETSIVDLPNLVRDLFDFYQGEKIRRDKAHIQINASIPDQGVRRLMTDPYRLRQIINNLISNSIKFTENGKVEFGYSIEGSNVLFFVTDTGIGMSESDSEIIFERFKQAGSSSKKKEGTGLGLAISKGLVEILGGRIWVNTQPGIGSSFYFSLPSNLSEQQIQEDTLELKSNDVQEFNWPGKTLLLVEDEEVNYLYINELLENTGINLLHVGTAEEAIRICQTSLGIDLILMDMRLPGINGFEATRQIKKIRSEVPIIAQTAYAMENDKKQCFDAGCDHYMAKPFDQEALFDVLNNFFEFSN